MPSANPQPSQHPDDIAIINELHSTIAKATKNFDNYELHLAAENLYEFIWNDFANEYIEKTKNRRQDAQPTLLYVLKTIIQALHPFMPFVTEEINEVIHQSLSADKPFQPLMTIPWPEIAKGNQ